MASARRPGFWLWIWLALTNLATPLLKRHQRKRLARGKELPDRWQEKLGNSTLYRPEGTLIWVHAVGLGEVLALRGLIAGLTAQRPDLSFLVTSGTRASAEVFGRNLPDRTQHQFLPLDSPRFVKPFFDHWRPDIVIWSEQDLWPGIVYEADRRGIPLALVNARMNARAFAARKRMRPLFRDVYGRFALFSAQDEASARHLEDLGAPAPVPVGGSLKPAAPPLNDVPPERARLLAMISDRPLWLAASTHPEDEAVALTAHRLLRETRPDALLILAPRLPERRREIFESCRNAGLDAVLRTDRTPLAPHHAVLIADTFGEMGLWYRLSAFALIGGSFGPVSGHNPWEAAQLGTAILHGPNLANFAADYIALKKAEAAILIEDATDLAALLQTDLSPYAARAKALADAGMKGRDALCQSLLALLPDATSR